MCGRGRDILRKRITVGKGDPPTLYFSRGNISDLLTLSQKYDAVCPAASDASREPSTADSYPATADYG